MMIEYVVSGYLDGRRVAARFFGNTVQEVRDQAKEKWGSGLSIQTVTPA
ncbi:MAG: hypothetical protein V4731_06215 [Pseudomonadota bacterium]